MIYYTPAGRTSAGATPAGATPAGATPAGATPAGATPAGATPAGLHFNIASLCYPENIMFCDPIVYLLPYAEACRHAHLRPAGMPI